MVIWTNIFCIPIDTVLSTSCFLGRKSLGMVCKQCYQKTPENPSAPVRAVTIPVCFPALAGLLRGLKKCAEAIPSTILGTTSPLMMFSNHLAKLRNERQPHEENCDFLQFFKDAEDSTFTGFLSEQVSGKVDVSTIRINKSMAPGVSFAAIVPKMERSFNSEPCIFRKLLRNVDSLQSLDSTQRQTHLR